MASVDDAAVAVCIVSAKKAVAENKMAKNFFMRVSPKISIIFYHVFSKFLLNCVENFRERDAECGSIPKSGIK